MPVARPALYFYASKHGEEIEYVKEMKRLIMCEGPNELEIMRILLEYDKLIFGEDELIGLTPYTCASFSVTASSIKLFRLILWLIA